MAEFEKRCAQLPEWYWVWGLHDAKILSFTELTPTADHKSAAPRYNRLEIGLDTEGAMTRLKKIVFYHYSLKSDIDMSTGNKLWWIGDELTRLSDGRFSLEVETEDAKGNRYTFTLVFDEAHVE